MNFTEIKYLESIQTSYYLNLLLFKSFLLFRQVAGNTEGYETWFDALKQMESEIDKADFDVALIGCGAYGFPSAAYCKSIGKQGIHTGGSLQLYFGIKGKRWDRFSFYNEFLGKPGRE